MREFEFIEWIRQQSRFDPAAVPLGPGDDMAAVTCGGEQVLVTVDQALEGVHFILADHGPEAVGAKAMNRNLSDVAAMAALPMAAVAAVALPKGFARKDAEGIYLGLRAAGDAFGCPVVGGDVSAWNGKLAISVTVLARAAGLRTILRSGAKVGDAICVTGQLGGAWRSRRHLSFLPRIKESRQLAARYNLHSMIDLSDGLAGDLAHICRDSAVGAEVLAPAIPIHPDVGNGKEEAKRDNNLAPARQRLMAALSDGEDYELLFSLPDDQAQDLIRTQPLAVPVTRIGTIIEAKDLVLLNEDGKREPLPGVAWQHAT
jgi:thiamine-monophosphate kinase